MLFTSKNQWLYLMHKEDGKWKIDTKQISSNGYNWSARYDTYIGSAIQRTDYGGWCYPIWYDCDEGKRKFAAASADPGWFTKGLIDHGNGWWSSALAEPNRRNSTKSIS